MKNELEHSIGDRWGKEFLSNQYGNGFIVEARSHYAPKHKKDEQVAFTFTQVSGMLKKLEHLKPNQKFVVIVRTFKDDTGAFDFSYCYLVVVPLILLQEYSESKSNMYFTKKGKRGEEAWKNLSNGLVKYYPISNYFLQKKVVDKPNIKKVTDLGFEIQDKDEESHVSTIKGLEIRFHKEMLAAYEKARKIGYNASKFNQMVANQGGLSVARKFIENSTPSYGFTNLWELGRLDLTVEALILHKDYRELFSNEELRVVRERLESYGYKVVGEARENSLSIPPLEPVKRSREYDSYNNEVKARAVFEYLFNSMTHREIDEIIIGLDPNESHGYQAMGILHYLGLKGNHKGIFSDTSLDLAIVILKQEEKDFSSVIQYLELLKNQTSKDDALGNVIIEDIEAELSEEDTYYTDGNVKEYYGKRYERNPENRKKAIQFHGLNCSVCGFDFEEFYGNWGKDFIEVHHLKPLSLVKAEVVVNPIEDLAPVCSNCHRMLHRKKNSVLSISELKDIIFKQKV